MYSSQKKFINMKFFSVYTLQADYTLLVKCLFLKSIRYVDTLNIFFF